MIEPTPLTMMCAIAAVGVFLIAADVLTALLDRYRRRVAAQTARRELTRLCERDCHDVTIHALALRPLRMVPLQRIAARYGSDEKAA